MLSILNINYNQWRRMCIHIILEMEKSLDISFVSLLYSFFLGCCFTIYPPSFYLSNVESVFLSGSTLLGLANSSYFTFYFISSVTLNLLNPINIHVLFTVKKLYWKTGNSQWGIKVRIWIRWSVYIISLYNILWITINQTLLFVKSSH